MSKQQEQKKKSSLGTRIAAGAGAAVIAAVGTFIAIKPSWKPEWNTFTRQTVQQVLPQLEKAKDITAFCPNYGVMKDKVAFWTKLIEVMTSYESGFKPALHYGEPPPLGYDSIGLLQLSYEDTGYRFCKLNRKAKTLEDPLTNLDCGIRILAHWTNRDGVISSPSNRGGARYWSVLRKSGKLAKVQADIAKSGVCK